ncbi:peptidoglycan DD-metalloendopeptidase family protein [Flavobacteriaceae bacterium]|nr:peptidoglycan DD-metalloendopeptidase family protein [Flavobacteriaceae bacterium]
MRKPLFIIVFSLISSFSFGQEKGIEPKRILVKSEKITIKGAIQRKPNQSNFENKSPRKSASKASLPLAVGRTINNLSVTDTGGASFLVPLMLPPGLQEAIPSVALGYNSQIGNSIAGWGWNIVGLSTISRIGATQFHDGVIDPVDLDALDRFALDGQRLILVEGDTYGTDGSVYTTENYSNLKITVSSYKNNEGVWTPTSFKVYYPDGSNTTYSSLSGFDWNITQLEDPFGNKILYQYFISGTMRLIDKIYYGSQSDETKNHPNVIKFNYDEVDPRQMSHVGGFSMYSKHLLTEVKVLTNQELYRSYTLSHNYSPSGYAQVNEIIEATATSQKPPISFGYDPVSDDLTQTPHELTTQNSVFSPDDSQILTGDFNGDGQIDYAEYSESGPTSIDLLLSKNNSLDGIVINTNLAIAAGGDPAAIVVTNYQDPERRVYTKNALTLIEEEVKSSTHITSTLPGQLSAEIRFRTYAVNGNGEDIVLYSKSWGHTNLSKNIACGDIQNAKIPKRYLSGDFNGDGIVDVLMINRPYSSQSCYPVQYGNHQDCNCSQTHINQSRVFFADMRRDLTTNFVTDTGKLSVSLGTDDQLYAADFDGDGKSDLYHFQAKHLYVYTLDKENKLQLRVDQEIDSYDPNTPVLLGDYNGDGKTDLLNPLGFTIANLWRIYYANGNDFTSRLIANSELTYQKNSFENKGKSIWGKVKVLFDRNANIIEGSSYSYIPQDVNGDGTTDIVKHERVIDAKRRYGEGNLKVVNKVSVYQNRFDPNGNSTFDYQSSFSTDKVVPIALSYGTILNVSRQNYNSGLTYSYILGETIYENELGSSHQEEVLLQSISHKGMNQQIDYQGLNTFEAASIYKQDYSQIYPYVNINTALNLPLAKQVSTTVDGQTAVEEFRYRGAISHFGGLGFQGFKAFGRTNVHGLGVKKIWNVTERDPQKRGAVVKRWNSVHPLLEEPNDIINKVDYSYRSQLNEKGVFINAVDAIHIQNSLTGVEQMRTFTYDDYYSPTRIYTEYYSKGNLDASTEENYTYQNNPSGTQRDYHVGRLDKEVVTNTRGDKSLTNTTDYITYSNNLPTVLKRSGSSTDIITENRSYDQFGNRTKSTFSAPGLAQQEEVFGYSSDGRFMESETNRRGITNRFTHTPAGRIETTTSPLGRTTTLAYDDLQRIISTTDYLEQTTTTDYSWDNNKLVETTTAAHGASSKRITDPSGRLLHRGERMKNSWQWTSQTYDVAGNLISRSEPYASKIPTTGGLKTYFGYDGYGRQTTNSLPNGSTRNISYALGSNETTVKDAYQTRKSTHDALGNIIKHTDPGGTLTFDYHPNGDLRTSNYEDHIVTSEQDGWGRKKSLTDPSTGNLSSDYNSFGQLTEEVSLWGTTTYGYTPQGLLDWKKQKGDATDLETQYTYVSGTDLVATEVTTDRINDDTYSISYTYDSQKRISEALESNSFARFTQALTYDTYGRIATDSRTVALEGGTANTSVLTHEYAENGSLKSIKNGTKTLWEITSETARGEVSAARLGNGITASKKIDALGFVDQIDAGDALQLALQYNKKKGVLDSRTRGSEKVEAFKHDNRNRLMERFKDTLQEQFEYDSYSRFMENPAVGEYHFDNPDNRYVLDSMYLNAAGRKYFTEHPKQTVDYNIDRKAVRVVEEGNGSADFVYNGSRERVHAFYGNEEEELENRTYSKHYSSLFPAEVTVNQSTGETTSVFYLGGDAYTAPVALINGEDHYLHRDHLGSILAISDATGTVVEERSFSPWGELDRFVQNGVLSTDFSTSILPRGFTGHEHFSKIALIHMNGRLYDPQLKRFLSPDNNLFDPFDTRSYDRYGYVLNNPLMNTDPSGEEPITIAAIVKIIKIIYAVYKVIDTTKKYIDGEARGPLPAIFAILAAAGAADAAGLVDIPFLNNVGNLCPNCSEAQSSLLSFGLTVVLPELINLVQQQNLTDQLQMQNGFGSLNQGNNTNTATEDFLVNQGNNTNIGTIEPISGGNGPYVPPTGGTIPGSDPADGEDDSMVVPNEEMDDDACTLVLVCPQGQVFDGLSCSCKTECNTTAGFIHTSAFAENIGLGVNTIINTDNFRNALGAIIASANCDSGKIFKNDVVNVLSSIPEVRSFIKADGSTGSSTYYPIEFTNCDGNLPDHQDYDPEKPCADCEGGNPLVNMNDLQNTPAGNSNPEDRHGGHYGWTRNRKETINADSGDHYHKYHSGYDIAAPVGTAIYAAHSGTIDALIDSHPNDVSQWTNADEEFNYDDYKEWRKNQTPPLPTNAGGNKIKIGWTENGLYFSHNYEHVQQGTILVIAGDVVTKGQLIGYTGITGNAQTNENGGPHLHFSKYDTTGAIDPSDDILANYNDDGHDDDPCDDN